MTNGKPTISNRQRSYPVSVSHLERITGEVCHRLGVPDASFTLLLSNDRAIRKLNQKFRHVDAATDVLSFPASPESFPGQVFENQALGDMIISVETAYRQAIQRGHSLDRELAILLIHGLLHLLGYDHETDRGQMRRKERLLQQELLC